MSDCFALAHKQHGGMRTPDGRHTSDDMLALPFVDKAHALAFLQKEGLADLYSLRLVKPPKKRGKYA